MAKNRTSTNPLTQKRQERLANLKWFYDLGQRIVQADKANPRRIGKNGWSWGVCQEFVESEGIDRTTADVARMFAKGYSPKQFKELCDLRTPAGLPLTRKHVKMLLTVRDPKKRTELQERAASDGWSCSRLWQEIKQRYRTAGPPGRAPQLPESRKVALVQMHGLVNQWLRWHQALEQAVNESGAQPAWITKLLAIQALSSQISASQTLLTTIEAELRSHQTGKSSGPSKKPTRPKK